MNKTQDKQNIHFFTGKGGVGKTIMAASKAMSLAATGKRVLLIELEGSVSLQKILKKESVKFDYVCLKPIEELKNLFTYFFKVKKISDLFFNNKAMKSLVEAAPGLKELAGLGKITSYNRSFGPSYDYDHIVVDAYSTGHFINWLNVPIGMSEVVKRGPMGEQCQSMVESLKDNEAVTYYTVVNPEKAPSEEGLLLSKKIKELTGISPVIVCNKFVKDNEGQKSSSVYVRQFIKESQSLLKTFKEFDATEMPFSFKESAFEKSVELSTYWKK